MYKTLKKKNCFKTKLLYIFLNKFFLKIDS